MYKFLPLAIALSFFPFNEIMSQQSLFCGIAADDPPGCLLCQPIYIGNTGGYLPGLIPNFCGTLENTQWLQIIACSTSVTVSITPVGCLNNNGVQLIMTNAGLFPVSNCFPGSAGNMLQGSVTANGLTPGEYYWIAVDGLAGDICDFVLQVVGAKQDVPGDPVPLVCRIEGLSQGCAKPIEKYKIECPPCPVTGNPCPVSPPGGCTKYNWTFPAGATIIGNPNGPEVNVSFSGPTSGPVEVEIENLCCKGVGCRIILLPFFINIEPGDMPAPPGDSCSNAPFFCGTFLDGYCTSNRNSTPDTPGNLNSILNNSIENNFWLGWTSCQPTAVLQISVANCQNSDGIEFAVLQTPDCEQFELIQEWTIASGNNSIITLSNLSPGDFYYLMADGISGDICDIAIDVISGIDTEPLQVTQVSPGRIDGPEQVCPEEIATYSLVLPVVEIIGGNSCPLPDTLCGDFFVPRIQWHIPDEAEFVGDSTGLSVQVVFPFANLNFDLDSVPLVSNDSILILLEGQIYAEINYRDTTSGCSYCEVICGLGIDPIDVSVIYNLDVEYADICEGDTYTFCSSALSLSGTYTCPKYCGMDILYLNVVEKQPPIIYPPVILCSGDCFTFPLSGTKVCVSGTHKIKSIDLNPPYCEIEEWATIIMTPAQIAQVSNIMEICDTDNATYTVSFDISSTSQPFLINNQVHNSNHFISDPIPNGQPYSFNIIPVDNCAFPTFINGLVNCSEPCNINAGTLPNNLLEACTHEFVQTIHFGDAIVEPGFISEYILHDGTTNEIGNILSRNTDGRFEFLNGLMQHDKIYHITHVVGVDLNNNADLSGDCRSKSNGQPIVFHQNPEILSFTSGTLTCAENAVSIEIQTDIPVTGWSWTGPGNFIFNEATPTIYTAGTYQLEVKTMHGCTDQKSWVVFEDRNMPQISLSAAQVLTCKETSVPIQVSLDRQNVTGVWTLPNGVTAPFTADQPLEAREPGWYILSVEDSENGCQDVEQIEILEDSEAPQISLSAAQMLTCKETSVPIQASLDRQNVTGVWTLPNGATAPFTADQSLEAREPGLYILLVEDSENGCQAATQQLIERITDMPVDLQISFNQPTCHGDSDGFILIENVVGGFPDYRFSFNGSAFLSKKEFENLPAGSYKLQVEDANGCILEKFVDLENPPLVWVNLGDDMIINVGEEVSLVAKSSITPFESKWTFPDGSNYFSTMNMDIQPLYSGLYRIEILDENGCPASDEQFVEVVDSGKGFYIPNAFSPNDDGVNDWFQIYSGKKIKQVKQLKIFSRWGDLIFEALDFSPDDSRGHWDGKYRNRSVQSGVYVYQVEGKPANGVNLLEGGDGTVEK